MRGRPKSGPRASFVIPVYNGTAYIAETLDSCVQQNLDNIEIVVVDDFSNDKTAEILGYFASKDKRIKIIKHDQNKGRSIARNTGIEFAKSSLLLMLDADDIALPNKAKDTVAFFDKNEDVDICYSKFHLINEFSNIIGYVDAEPFDINKVRETKFMFIGHSTMAFKRHVYEKVQYTDGDFAKHAIDDWKFQIDAYKAGFKFGPLRKITTQYRVIPKIRNEAKILQLKESCLEAIPC